MHRLATIIAALPPVSCAAPPVRALATLRLLREADRRTTQTALGESNPEVGRAAGPARPITARAAATVTMNRQWSCTC